MKGNETPVSKAIKAKLQLVNKEVEAAWSSDQNAIYSGIDPTPYAQPAVFDLERFRDRSLFFVAITTTLIRGKAKSMIATALEALSNVGADENLQVEVKKFILRFFDYSDYSQRLPVFVDEFERKFRSQIKDYNPEELGLTKIEDLFQSCVKEALRIRREEINAEFTLLHAQTTPKHLEVREEVVSVPSFEHSEDFRSVSYFGKQYTLTSRQAEVIEILFKGWEKGTPEIGQAYILNKVSPDTSQKRLRDIFKRDPKAWKALIEPGDKKGTFRLKK